MIEIRHRETGEVLAQVEGVSLQNACLEGTDVREADLCAADLSDADLTGAVLTAARYNAATRWPEGFDPEAHGALRVI